MVAEGVEGQTTWDELVRYGCDEIHGYHLAHPMPGPQVGHWLTGHRQQVHALDPLDS